MSGLMKTWVFEPHGGYGSAPLDGEPWPYGYISQDSPRSPIFELSTPLVWKPEELRGAALLMAAAPELLEACKALQMEARARGCDLRIADEAIAKAEGASS